MSALRSFRHAIPEFAALRHEMDRIFREQFGGETSELASSTGWSPEIDVEETDERIVLHLDIAGVDPEDIEVSVDDGLLSISGERRFYEDREVEGFRRVERRFGTFTRSLRLPSQADPESIDAHYSDGVLTVTIEKQGQPSATRIEIRTT